MNVIVDVTTALVPYQAVIVCHCRVKLVIQIVDFAEDSGILII